MHVAIVGNSAAALSALESFRERDWTSSVTLVCDEAGPAYSRVLLPYYLCRKLSYNGLFIRQMEYYSRMRAHTIFGARVEGIDSALRRLELADGRKICFDQLLVATGSSPARPPIPGLDGPGIRCLWTLEDVALLDPLLQVGARVLVLGSGFVALQAAWAAWRRGVKVTVVELEEHILPRVLDGRAARILHEQVLGHGVDIYTGARTDSFEPDGRKVRVSASAVGRLSVDAVIVATGARPNDRLLSECLEPGQPGIPVAPTMETVVDGVFAAGDVTRGPTAAGGPPEIHALWPTAVEQGRVAGANLAGAGLVYGGSLSMNVIELFGVTVASLGRFTEDEADDVFELHDLTGTGYLKIVSRSGVPVGAISIGEAEGVALLGRLRPFVRQKRRVADVRAILEGRDLAQSVARVGATRRARPGPGVAKERAGCASLR